MSWTLFTIIYITGALMAPRFVLPLIQGNIDRGFDQGTRTEVRFTPSDRALAVLAIFGWPSLLLSLGAIALCYAFVGLVTLLLLAGRQLGRLYMKLMFPAGLTSSYARERAAHQQRQRRAAAAAEAEALAERMGLPTVRTIALQDLRAKVERDYANAFMFPADVELPEPVEPSPKVMAHVEAAATFEDWELIMRRTARELAASGAKLGPWGGTATRPLRGGTR